MSSRKSSKSAPVQRAGWLPLGRIDAAQVPRHIKYLGRPIHCANFWEVCPLDYDKEEKKYKLDKNGKLQPKRNAKGEPLVQKLYHHFAPELDWGPCGIDLYCTCQPGPHVQALLSDCEEVGAHGGRGSGKSELSLSIIVRGNLGKEASGDPTDRSYIFNPNYRYLVLRRNVPDLADIWRRAKKFFTELDSRTQFTENPHRIRHPSGAEGVFDHMDGPDAYMKYQGQEFQTIVFEELGQCAKEDDYEKIRLSCRSTDPRLKKKIYVTYNPGGPGASWIKRRFHRAPFYKDGKLVGILPVPPGTPIRAVGGERRVTFKSTVFDNPYFLRGGGGYVAALRSIKDPILRAQWLEGDMDAFEGQFFPEFREEPRVGEPANACHMYDPAKFELKPWWPRWISLDWGFRHSSVAYFFCQAPDGRVFVYRELERKTTVAEDLGESLAHAAFEDIKQQPGLTMPVFISPEIWPGGGIEFEKSLVGQIAAGVDRVLGQGSVFIDKSGDGPQYGKCNLIFRQAFNKRIEGWQYMRSLMRWTLLPSEEKQGYDIAQAMELQRQGKMTEFRQYMDKCANAGPPPKLPRLQISMSCRLLREAIPQAQFVGTESAAAKKGYAAEDLLKQNTTSDDALDAARYGLAAYYYQMNEAPYQEFLAARMERVPENMRTADSLVHVNRKAEQDWEARHGAAGGQIFLPRAASRRFHEMEPVEEQLPHPALLLE